MKFIVSIIPEGESDNEYSTPCIFTFSNIGDATDFVNSAMMHGNVIIEISKIKL